MPEIKIASTLNRNCRVYTLTDGVTSYLISNGPSFRCSIPFQVRIHQGVFLSPFCEILLPELDPVGLVSEVTFSTHQLQVLSKRRENEVIASDWEKIDMLIVNAISRLYGIEFAYRYVHSNWNKIDAFVDKSTLSPEELARRKIRSLREKERQARIREEKASAHVKDKAQA